MCVSMYEILPLYFISYISCRRVYKFISQAIFRFKYLLCRNNRIDRCRMRFLEHNTPWNLEDFTE